MIQYNSELDEHQKILTELSEMIENKLTDEIPIYLNKLYLQFNDEDMNQLLEDLLDYFEREFGTDMLDAYQDNPDSWFQVIIWYADTYSSNDEIKDYVNSMYGDFINNTSSKHFEKYLDTNRFDICDAIQEHADGPEAYVLSISYCLDNMVDYRQLGYAEFPYYINSSSNDEEELQKEWDRINANNTIKGYVEELGDELERKNLGLYEKIMIKSILNDSIYEGYQDKIRQYFLKYPVRID